MTNANAQVLMDFEPRTSYLTPNRTIYNIKGDFTMIGNKNLTLPVYNDNGTNGNTNMVYVDIDGDPTTVNSSMAELLLSTENDAIPECSRIIYAGLYWTGRAHTGNSPNSFNVFNPGTGSTVPLDKGVVKLKHAEAPSYTTFYASHSDYSQNIYFPDNEYGNMYSAYAEVTDYVRQYGIGQYFVADIALREGNGGNTGYYGGWGMVVVYENSAMSWRDVTIFDGHAHIQSPLWGNVNYELEVEGFRTVQDGPVNLKLGLMAGEGDSEISGCSFAIIDQENQWVLLDHEQNNTNNFFNSSILTGGNPRNPNRLNNFGMDIAMFDINNDDNEIITNNQTATSFRYSTNQDTYIIFCIAMAVDAYIPDIEALHQVVSIDENPVVPDGNLEVNPGERIEFLLKIKNKEPEDIHDFTVTIPVPFATRFVIGSAQTEYFEGIYPEEPDFFYDPSAGPTGSLIWNIGTLSQQADPDIVLATLNYTLEVTTDCFVLSNQSCDLEVIIGGSITGVGSEYGIFFANIPLIQGYVEQGECQDDPITEPIRLLIQRDGFIQENCQPLDDYLTRNFDFCNLAGTNIPFSGISANFPAGSRFYDSIDFDEVAPLPDSFEFTPGASFPIVAGNQSYFAIPPGSTSCYWEFTISVGELSVSSPDPLTICLGQEVVQPLHATTGVTAIEQPVVPLPPGIVAAFVDNTISIYGTPQQAGVYHYSIPLLGDCQGFFAEGTIEVREITANAFVTGNVTCHNDSNGSIEVETTNGEGDFLFSIDGENYSDQAYFENLSAGLYSVYVVDDIGCTTQVEAELANPSPLLLSFEETVNVRCKGESNGSVRLEGAGGWGNYSFSDDGENFVLDNTFANLQAGNYTFFVKDHEGCIQQESIEIFEPEDELEGAVSILQPLCHGDNNGEAIASALFGWENYSYLWDTSPPQNNATATGLGAGNYQVTVTDEMGCSISLEVEVTQPESLLIDGFFVEEVHCKRIEQGGSISIGVLGGVEPYSFSWFDEQNTQLIEQDEASIEGISEGTYLVIVADENGCLVEQNFVVNYLDEECVVRIPQGFSPDGDGVNDYWVIRNLLEEHPDNLVKVFNREGTLVFEAHGYADNWDGTPNQGNILVGKDGKVPSGVYYYIIWFDFESTPITGYVYVSY